MNQVARKSEQDRGPDFSLVFSRLEAEILKGDLSEKTKRAFLMKRFWERMPPERLPEWARLAQMAGELESVLAMLAWLNRRQPDCVAGWVQRLELLSVLGRKKEIARVMGAAGKHLDKEQRRVFHNAGAGHDPDPDDDIQAAREPFEQLRLRQQRIARFMELFRGREDCFARQWAGREDNRQGYVPVRRAMTAQDVEDHLGYRKTYGIYLLDTRSNVRLGVIDADIASAFRKPRLPAEQKRQVHREQNYMITRIKECSKSLGQRPLLEFSGNKGFHFWYFFNPAVQASTAKQALEEIRVGLQADLSVFKLEVFPKQASLSKKGFGNLVKLPLGVHRLSGKKSFFPECRDRRAEAQLDYLAGITPAAVDRIRQPAKKEESEKILVHPRWQQWAADWPELYALETRCPPMGQLICSCRNADTLTAREEKVIFQTIGFLPRAKSLLHYLFTFSSEYNPHLVDFQLSKIRGTPLGCRRVHSLLAYSGDLCQFENHASYIHPLLHVDDWTEKEGAPKAQKVENLASALENLKIAIRQTQKFIK